MLNGIALPQDWGRLASWGRRADNREKVDWPSNAIPATSPDGDITDLHQGRRTEIAQLCTRLLSGIDEEGNIGMSLKVHEACICACAAQTASKRTAEERDAIRARANMVTSCVYRDADRSYFCC